MSQRNHAVRSLSGAAAIAGVALAITGCMPMMNAPEDRDDAAEAALAAEIVGTWTGDTSGDVSGGEPAELTFVDDGTFSGTDGCNTLTGRWEADEVEIEFEDVALTQRACLDFTPWLSRLDTATLSGTTLTIFDDPGAEIGTLTRN
ncbi:META domain-containing protein [Leucobacter sp. NPDC077196]|uniref:META domain-containing protein n=1 Tax=Leucobacter sp. NPDC077196 TaxID=3154959 RepID=UPI003418F1B2